MKPIDKYEGRWIIEFSDGRREPAFWGRTPEQAVQRVLWARLGQGASARRVEGAYGAEGRFDALVRVRGGRRRLVVVGTLSVRREAT